MARSLSIGIQATLDVSLCVCVCVGFMRPAFRRQTWDKDRPCSAWLVIDWPLTGAHHAAGCAAAATTLGEPSMAACVPPFGYRFLASQDGEQSRQIMISKWLRPATNNKLAAAELNQLGPNCRRHLPLQFLSISFTKPYLSRLGTSSDNKLESASR